MNDKKPEVKQQNRFSESELATIKSLFGGDDSKLILLRKIFLPELDLNAPIAQMVDLWMGKNYQEMPADEAKINIIARRDLIMHIESALQMLQLLANTKEETVEQLGARMAKNSSK